MKNAVEPIETMENTVETITEEERKKRWEKRWEEENHYECDVEGCDYGLDGRPYRTNSGRALNRHKSSNHNVTPRDGYDAKRRLLTLTIPNEYQHIGDILNSMDEEKARRFVMDALRHHLTEVLLSNEYTNDYIITE